MGTKREGGISPEFPEYAEFASYDDYFGKSLLSISRKVTAIGLLLMMAQVAWYAAARGTDARFAAFAARYAIAAAGIGVMLAFLRSRRIRPWTVPGVIASGNLSMLVIVTHKAIERASLHEIAHIFIIYMFGVIVIAPILRVRVFAPFNLVANAAAVAILRMNGYSASDVADFLYISLTLSAFLVAILHYQAGESRKNYGLARDNWVLSTTDSLTGLLNRRAWTERAARSFDLCVGDRSFMMLDIDHFKRVNDSLGHACGDLAIRAVADAIRSGVREGDVAGRLGGEEFGIFCGSASYADAREIAERLRERIASREIPCSSGTFRVTVSVGLVVGFAPSLEELVRIGDDCLYSAKLCGRNRVIGNVRPSAAISARLPLQALWSEDFASGNEGIDREHRELIERVNELFLIDFAGMSGPDAARLASRLSADLCELIAKHFESEENTLRSLGYGELDGHAASHAEALRSAKALVEVIGSGTVAVSDAIYTIYKEIILGHMLVEDVKYFPLTRARSEARAT